MSDQDGSFLANAVTPRAYSSAFRAVANPLDPETLHPYSCKVCGELIEHVVLVRFKGRDFHFHLACLLDDVVVMSLLLPLVPAARPL